MLNVNSRNVPVIDSDTSFNTAAALRANPNSKQVGKG